MKMWTSSNCPFATGLLADLVGDLGEVSFVPRMLGRMREVLNAASMSVYRAGPHPELLFSGSLGVPDRTLDCWRAYLSGPYKRDTTLRPLYGAQGHGGPFVCHISAQEMAREHRARVYEPHGVAERISVVQSENERSTFTVNFYRHDREHAFCDHEIEGFSAVAPALLALARKHAELSHYLPGVPGIRQHLQRHCGTLTQRELDVCERLAAGMTYEGIAADLGLSVPTVKTYRARAFDRLGIHFRNQLTALLLPRPGAVRLAAH